MQYVMEWRMRRAAQYLLETDTLVGEIAGLVGFNSQAYFTRMFVQHFSCTPVAFRNRN
jgi:two-component system response regulator YesN